MYYVRVELVTLYYSVHACLWKCNLRCNLFDWSLWKYCDLDKNNITEFIIRWSSQGTCSWVCPKHLKSRTNSTNRTLSAGIMDRIGMTTLKFLSCLPLTKAKGTEKDNFRLFLTLVPVFYITHFVLFYLEQKRQCSLWHRIYGTLCITTVILWVKCVL